MVIMSKSATYAPSWDTSSFGHSPDISPMECSSLGEHLTQCGALRGPLLALHSGAVELKGAVSKRVITSMLLVLLVVGGTWLML
jgi:hypothetical protein